MFRGVLLLALAVILPQDSVHAFFHAPATPVRRRHHHAASVVMSGSHQDDNKEGLTWSKGVGALGRSFAATTVLFSTVLGGVSMQGAAAWAAPTTVNKQTKTTPQKQQSKEAVKAEKELQTELIAKGVIRLPEVEGYPTGPERPGVINYALENDNAALLITCYGREGGPVAAKRIPLRGLQFPYTFELTANNLLFPLTKETWGKDNRAFDDLGISALLDLDGKFSSANENDLLGFGISKPVAIAGSQIRRDALIVVSPRTGVKDYTEEEQRLLSTIDLELARQAQGASLAQLAQESGGGNIEVLTNQRQTEPADPTALTDSIE